jgi:chromate transporter
LVPNPDAPQREPRALAEVAVVFLKLGALGFGGPAAHVAMMRQEVVERRGWVSEQEFLDTLGVTGVIPGPGSTQMAIYLARRRAGWPGLVVGGACFILPAMAIVLALAWAYVEYGATTIGRGLLYGITPVVVGIVADAVIRLGRTAVRTIRLAVLTGLVVVGWILGAPVLLLLLGAGAAEALAAHAHTWRDRGAAAVALFGIPLGAASGGARGTQAHGVSLWDLFLEFLKLGSVVFGSGYVLFAYLQHDLVDHLHWLTPQQLVDAIAAGQVTPGPVFTTATFVGYLVAGFWGGVVATFAIFLPSFLLVAAFGWIVPHLRRWTWSAAALDGINAAAVAVMAAVTWDLADVAVIDVLTALLAAGAFVVMLRWRPNFLWLLLAGAGVGVVHALV